MLGAIYLTLIKCTRNVKETCLPEWHIMRERMSATCAGVNEGHFTLILVVSLYVNLKQVYRAHQLIMIPFITYMSNLFLSILNHLLIT